MKLSFLIKIAEQLELKILVYRKYGQVLVAGHTKSASEALVEIRAMPEIESHPLSHWIFIWEKIIIYDTAKCASSIWGSP